MAEPTALAARVVLSALGALAAAALLEHGAPPPAPSTAPQTEFSAERASAILADIAREPHPLDSDANERARLHIEAQLEVLGVRWERQAWEVHVRTGQAGPPALATGVNLLARLPGTLEDGPVALFVCHYDSRPGPVRGGPEVQQSGASSEPRLRELDRAAGGAPGAGDDGAAVAAFLEALRALRAAEPLLNELWFLFTDGEEYGLLGAEAFADQPGALERVAVALNFEGRGNGGPVVLFETGRDEAPWIRAYARSVPWPQASSLGPTVYERLPNDTDFSVFKRRGLPGLNFAFIAGGSAYHCPWDTPQNLDPRSLQHHGEIALGLARHLGAANLAQLNAQSGRSAYFTLPGNVLVHYPRSMEIAVALGAALAVVGAIAFGVRTGALRLRGVCLATLGFPFITLVAAGSLLGGAWAVDRAVPAAMEALGWISEHEPRGNRASSAWSAVGVVFLAATLMALAASRARRAWIETLGAGAAVAWSAAAVWASIALPGAAHVLTWPALFGAIGLHCSVRSGRMERGGSVTWLSGVLSVLPVLIVMLPVLDLLAQVGSVASSGPVLLSSLVAAPMLGLLLPPLRGAFAATPKHAVAGAGAASFAALAWGAHLAARGL